MLSDWIQINQFPLRASMSVYSTARLSGPYLSEWAEVLDGASFLLSFPFYFTLGSLDVPQIGMVSGFFILTAHRNDTMPMPKTGKLNFSISFRDCSYLLPFFFFFLV